MYTFAYDSARFVRNLSRYVKGSIKTTDQHLGNRITVPGFRHAFCGYYDRAPFRPGQSNQLLIHASNENSLLHPRPGSTCSLWLYDHGKRTVIQCLGQSRAWNWQQGARLMWLDDCRAVFNVDVGENYQGKWVDVDTGETGLLPWAVQDVHCGTFVSLDYRILARFRPDYGYFAHQLTNERLFPSLRYMKVDEPGTENTITWEEISAVVGLRRGELPYGARVNHALISPSGIGFVFLFRMADPRDRRTTLHFLLYKNTKNNTLRLLARDSMISHFCWIDDLSLVMWAQFKTGGGYFCIDTDGSSRSILAGVTDGHPTRISDRVFITDTYADGMGRRHLYMVSRSGETKWIGSWKEFPPFRVAARCDLHPSVSDDGRLFQLDIRPGLTRQVFIGEVPAFQEDATD
jgi:hypothetical protein